MHILNIQLSTLVEKAPDQHEGASGNPWIPSQVTLQQK